MVSIQYGGGPTLEQRQNFCNLRYGSHVPGYVGFVPQRKFQNGNTYGKETNDCASKLAYYAGPQNQSVIHRYPQVGQSKDCASRGLFRDEIFLKKLPLPTGDNKYTEKMMPGYSGDIPRNVNRFGGTYRAMCDEGIDEFITDYERNKAIMADIIKMATLFPKLRPIKGDPGVRDHMNLWSDRLVKISALATDRRSLMEPPIPGYTGFVPRTMNTELGLGARYHKACKRSLEVFRDDNSQHFCTLEKPMKVENNVYTVANYKSLSLAAQTEPRFSSRIFNKDGMIPSYTGHVHRSTELVGLSTGDTSRSLQVCAHDFPCYGDYVKNIDLAVK